MAKKASPWFWEARNGWYVLLNGQRHFLGEHPADAPRPQKSKKTGKWNSPAPIDEAFHRLMRGESPQAAQGGDSVVAVLDDFITWAKENRAGITAKRYEEFCQDFVNAAAEGGVLFGSLAAVIPDRQACYGVAEPAPDVGADHQEERHHRPHPRLQLGCQEPRPRGQPDPRHGEAGGQAPVVNRHPGGVRDGRWRRPAARSPTCSPSPTTAAHDRSR